MSLSKTFTALLSLLAFSNAHSAEPVDYQRDVFPILETHCIGCHTADEAQGGLVMETHAQLMAGGDTGLSVTAGAPISSRMMLMTLGKIEPKMPPDGAEQPSEEEMETLTAWIEQGAKGPDGKMPIKRTLRTPAIESRDGISKPITAITSSPVDSQRAIARYGNVIIVDGRSEVVATLDRELNKVNSLQFSEDGSRILVASGLTGAYGNAAIFSTKSGELLQEFTGHRDVLYSAAFSPDETRIATAGYDRDIILWDTASGEPIRSLTGHNGAIFDLAFSPDGKILVSACADETVKVWNVETGERLDTLSQPEGEVFSTAITKDGKFILAGSADNRLRVWRLKSKDRPRINPIVATRFVDEAPLVNFALTPEGDGVVVLSEAGNVKVIRTSDWNQAAALEPLGETGSDLAISEDGKTVSISLMNGSLAKRELPSLSPTTQDATTSESPVYLDLGPLKRTSEKELRDLVEPIANREAGTEPPLTVARGASIDGVISSPSESDSYRWLARRGEVWAIDADAAEKSPIDPVITIHDAEGQPVLRTKLQAVRDSYFTFRGKDSLQIGDFRLFNWEEMHLNDYLYASGEVTRLWMYPRGPDSGYNVYPNEGNRWTFFGTTHTTHALGEPAYIVRPLREGESPVANGLPVFDIYVENDDDPSRVAGKNSRVIFKVPAEGHYTARISDTRGEGGEPYAYQLKIRPAEPGFKASVAKTNDKIRRGSGREFIVRVDRIDGYDGPVTFDIPNLPTQLTANVPLTIQSGQRFAVGTLWVGEHAEDWEGKLTPELVATAEVNGKVVERHVGPAGEIEISERPNAIPSIHPIDRDVAEDESWTLKVQRGETVSARVKIRRKEGFTAEVGFGKENSGRNTAHGVYVDNIGLSGLLVRANENEREFFLTADAIAEPGKRTFFLTGEIDGKVTTHPIIVEVLP